MNIEIILTVGRIKVKKESYSVLHYTKRGGLMIAAHYALKWSPRYIQVLTTKFDINDGGRNSGIYKYKLCIKCFMKLPKMFATIGSIHIH